MPNKHNKNTAHAQQIQDSQEEDEAISEERWREKLGNSLKRKTWKLWKELGEVF